jgi:hypothetical protein|tara:strand:+ start:458 stop:658 length:201 start_codon:yes stop_codon:yes gene_type:complete
MKDQNVVRYDDDSHEEKWKRAHSLYIESILKPDNELRSCAHNQKCYNELMGIREEVLNYVKGMLWH